MKKILSLFILLVLSIFIASCENSFNPKGEFKEEFSVNAIVRLDTNYQVVTVSKTFDVEGYNPSMNTNSTFISGCNISLTDSNYYDKSTIVYKYRDTTINRSSGSLNSAPMHSYYINNFKMRSYTILMFRVQLPNGKIISKNLHQFKIPELFYLNKFKKEYPKLINGSKLQYAYAGLGSGCEYLPEMIIKYSKNINGSWKDFQKEIPIYYANNAGKKIAIYPDVDARKRLVVYDTLVIRNELLKVSEGDTDKNNYKIQSVEFMLHLLSLDLGIYISLNEIFKSDFSVRLTQPDFSSGGVFGLIYSVKNTYTKSQSYFKSLGYNIE